MLSLEKYDDQNRLKTLVKDVTRRSTGGQRQRSKVTVDVSSQHWSTESKVAGKGQLLTCRSTVKLMTWWSDVAVNDQCDCMATNSA